jgi:hypothetical protein
LGELPVQGCGSAVCISECQSWGDGQQEICCQSEIVCTPDSAKIFQQENRYAESSDIPTLQDFEEIIAAFVNGNDNKPLVMSAKA